jgi:hypothetical protein
MSSSPQIMDPANRSITQTKTPTMVQGLHVLPNTYYYYRMEQNHYFYRPSNNGRNQQEYHPNQDPHLLPNTYYYRLEPHHYVYPHNIRLVLVIAWGII